MVLREWLAAYGFSFSCLYFFSRQAVLLPSISFMLMKDIGVDKSAASRMEHKNDILKAVKK